MEWFTGYMLAKFAFFVIAAFIAGLMGWLR